MREREKHFAFITPWHHESSRQHDVVSPPAAKKHTPIDYEASVKILKQIVNIVNIFVLATGNYLQVC